MLSYNDAALHWCSSVERALLLATVYPWQRRPTCRKVYFCRGTLSCLDEKLNRAPELCDLQFALLYHTSVAAYAPWCDLLLQVVFLQRPQLPSSRLFATQSSVAILLHATWLKMLCSKFSVPLSLFSPHYKIQQLDLLLVMYLLASVWNLATWCVLRTPLLYLIGSNFPRLPLIHFAFNATFSVQFIYCLFMVSIKAEETQP